MQGHDLTALVLFGAILLRSWCCRPTLRIGVTVNLDDATRGTPIEGQEAGQPEWVAASGRQ